MIVELFDGIRPTLVVLETATTGCGHLVFESACQLDANILFLAKDLAKYRRVPEIAQCLEHPTVTCIELDTANLDAVLLELKNHKCDGIFTSFDGTVELAAIIAEKLHLRFLSSQVVHICRDKSRLAELLRDLESVPSPESMTVSNSEDYVLLEVLQFPVVVKPANGTGSMNARYCRDINEAIAQCQIINIERNIAVVQQFVSGPLVSVETFTYDGNTSIIGITDRILGCFPNFVEVAWSFPVDLGCRVNDMIACFIHMLFAKLDLNNAVCHTEFVISNNGPVLIELNPRIGGMRLADAMGLSCNASIYKEMIRMHLGQTPIIFSATKTGMMEYHIYAPYSGVLLSVSGIDIASICPGIIKIESHYSELIGIHVDPPKDFRGVKLITIIAKGDSTMLAKANCFNAISHILICIAKQL